MTDGKLTKLLERQAKLAARIAAEKKAAAEREQKKHEVEIQRIGRLAFAAGLGGFADSELAEKFAAVATSFESH